MGYKSETVASTIQRLNVNHFLPAIQREFVWGPEKIVQLFDSLLRGSRTVRSDLAELGVSLGLAPAARTSASGHARKSTPTSQKPSAQDPFAS
jgi:hypothetical protein